jgi:hypothetical protein
MLRAAAVLLVMVGCSHGARELGPAGTQVTLRGRISNKPWAHMMTGVPGKQPAYFDHADRQTVVYWATAPSCPAEIEITGTVIEARGPSKKRPSSTEPVEDFVERSIDVDTVRCVEQ